MGRAKPDRAQPQPPSPSPSTDGEAAGKRPLADAVERVEKKRRASGAKQISKLIEEHPDEAVNVLRGWLHQSQ